MTQSLELSLILRDPEIQPREEMDQDAIAQYAEAMLAGAQFPPVVVYRDKAGYWLSQGFHRCRAAEVAGLESIPANIHAGTRQDAMWDAAGSNREHDTSGLRRTNADKRRAVQMALEARPKLSDTQIAKQVGVSVPTVSGVRKSIYKNFIDDREVTRNGTTYTMQTGGIGRRPEPREEADAGLPETWQEIAESDPDAGSGGRRPLPGQRDLFTEEDREEARAAIRDASPLNGHGGEPAPSRPPKADDDPLHHILQRILLAIAGVEAAPGQFSHGWGGLEPYVRKISRSGQQDLRNQMEHIRDKLQEWMDVVDRVLEGD